MKQLSFSTLNPIRRFTPAWTLSLAAPLFLALAHTAQAHPGHPLGEHGTAHVVSSPYHISILAGTGLALWLASRFVKSPFGRRLLQAGGIAAVIFAAAWWGVSM